MEHVPDAPVRAVETEDDMPEPGEIIRTPSGSLVIGAPMAVAAGESPLPSGGAG